MRFAARAAVGFACASAAIATACAPGAAAKSLFVPCAPRGAAPAFARYYLGDPFAGLPLSDSFYRCDRPHFPEPGPGAHFASYLYGDCNAEAEGCALPYEVQSAPVCSRNLSSYSNIDGGPLSSRLTTVRGVPAADFGNDRLELYTGTTTIIVFGNNPTRAAAALQTVPGVAPAIAPGDRLPAPTAGVLYGRIDCGLARPRVVLAPRRGAVRVIVRLPRRATVTATFERLEPLGRFRSRFAPRSRYRPWTSPSLTGHKGRNEMRADLPEGGTYRVWVTATDATGRSSRPLRLRVVVPHK